VKNGPESDSDCNKQAHDEGGFRIRKVSCRWESGLGARRRFFRILIYWQRRVDRVSLPVPSQLEVSHSRAATVAGVPHVSGTPAGRGGGGEPPWTPPAQPARPGQVLPEAEKAAHPRVVARSDRAGRGQARRPPGPSTSIAMTAERYRTVRMRRPGLREGQRLGSARPSDEAEKRTAGGGSPSTRRDSPGTRVVGADSFRRARWP